MKYDREWTQALTQKNKNKNEEKMLLQLNVV